MTPENREKFEKMGAEMVRVDLLRGLTIQKGPMTEQALAWLGEQDRRNRRVGLARDWVMLILTLVAAAAAVVAAWPVLFD